MSIYVYMNEFTKSNQGKRRVRLQEFVVLLVELLVMVGRGGERLAAKYGRAQFDGRGPAYGHTGLTKILDHP